MLVEGPSETEGQCSRQVALHCCATRARRVLVRRRLPSRSEENIFGSFAASDSYFYAVCRQRSKQLYQRCIARPTLKRAVIARVNVMHMKSETKRLLVTMVLQ